ncbi:MAG: hypothetical protein HRU75_14615 [Planctomycetia bacterium]|nr:MAG: hypothetical protein HRU75_14615 [Planctomycetia bacterium]
MAATTAGTLNVELIRLPTSAGAEKTLIRLFRKDAAVIRKHRQMKRNRPSLQTWRRGGNYWHHQMKTQPGVKVAVGEKFTIPATVDVLRDIEGVKQFLKISGK